MKIIRLMQHFRQIYLFGQIKIQSFVPSGHSAGILLALCRYSSILVLKTLAYSSHLRHLGTRGTQGSQGTRIRKALKQLRHWGTQVIKALGGWLETLFSRRQGNPFTGILSIFAKSPDRH